MLQASKDSIVKEAREFVKYQIPEYYDQSGSCLFYSFGLYCILKRYNIRACIQAGTAKWPRMEREKCCEYDYYQFGYQWDLRSSQTVARIIHGLLPEIHCWVGLPETQEIVDLTSGFFPKQCQDLIGKDWPGIQPPDYFWWKVKDPLPDGVEYEASQSAIDVALMFLKKLIPSKEKI